MKLETAAGHYWTAAKSYNEHRRRQSGGGFIRPLPALSDLVAGVYLETVIARHADERIAARAIGVLNRHPMTIQENERAGQ